MKNFFDFLMSFAKRRSETLHDTAGERVIVSEKEEKKMREFIADIADIPDIADMDNLDNLDYSHLIKMEPVEFPGDDVGDDVNNNEKETIVEKTKAQKATEILRSKGIAQSCTWLLGVYSDLNDVPGVKSVEQKYTKFCKFSYNGKSYGLFYENFRNTLPDGEVGGDFRINIDSEDVLITSVWKEYDEYSVTYSIPFYSVKKVKLGNWLEVIPQIAAESQRIYAEKTQQEEEKRARELDEKIDLGEYE